jgi:hypothetical protein
MAVSLVKAPAVKNYSDAQEARLTDAATANGGKIDGELAKALAIELDKDVRSIRAKATRMGIYQPAAKVSKTGGKIESKEEIAADIAEIVGKNMDGLEKAPKLVLQILRTKLSA